MSPIIGLLPGRPTESLRSRLRRDRPDPVGRTSQIHRNPRTTFAGELDFQHQLDRWFAERANVRFHRTLRCRPLDRLVEELTVMRPLPERMPDVDRRLVTRVPPDPYVRVDSNDYSLDPWLVGRRVELKISQREILAVVLETGELACRHARSFALHRTITALEHARALRELRGGPAEPKVEQRPLAQIGRAHV